MKKLYVARTSKIALLRAIEDQKRTSDSEFIMAPSPILKKGDDEQVYCGQNLLASLVGQKFDEVEVAPGVQPKMKLQQKLLLNSLKK